jgi:hypothetical protein
LLVRPIVLLHSERNYHKDRNHGETQPTEETVFSLKAFADRGHGWRYSGRHLLVEVGTAFRAEIQSSYQQSTRDTEESEIAARAANAPVKENADSRYQQSTCNEAVFRNIARKVHVDQRKTEREQHRESGHPRPAREFGLPCQLFADRSHPRQSYPAGRNASNWGTP